MVGLSSGFALLSKILKEQPLTGSISIALLGVLALRPWQRLKNPADADALLLQKQQHDLMETVNSLLTMMSSPNCE